MTRLDVGGTGGAGGRGTRFAQHGGAEDQRPTAPWERAVEPAVAVGAARLLERQQGGQDPGRKGLKVVFLAEWFGWRAELVGERCAAPDVGQGEVGELGEGATTAASGQQPLASPRSSMMRRRDVRIEDNRAAVAVERHLSARTTGRSRPGRRELSTTALRARRHRLRRRRSANGRALTSLQIEVRDIGRIGVGPRRETRPTAVRTPDGVPRSTPGGRRRTPTPPADGHGSTSMGTPAAAAAISTTLHKQQRAVARAGGSSRSGPRRPVAQQHDRHAR